MISGVSFMNLERNTEYSKMDRESFRRQFMEEVWNKKSYEFVEKYVHPEYKIHLDTADPWEGKP